MFNHSLAHILQKPMLPSPMLAITKRRISRSPTGRRAATAPRREQHLLALLDFCDHHLAAGASPPLVCKSRVPINLPRYTSCIPVHTGYYAKNQFKPLFMDAIARAVTHYEGALLESQSPLIVPPPWKEASEPLRVQFYDLAIRNAGEVTNFTARLSHDRRDETVKTRKSFLRATQDNLAKSITRGLGSPLPCWFTLEATSSDDPHLHGILAIDGVDLKVARRALRQAAGPSHVPGFASHQIDMVAPFNITGWSAYATKGLETTSTILDCRPISATKDIRSEAEALYGEVRQLVQSARCAGRSPAEHVH